MLVKIHLNKLRIISMYDLTSKLLGLGIVTKYIYDVKVIKQYINSTAEEFGIDLVNLMIIS